MSASSNSTSPSSPIDSALSLAAERSEKITRFEAFLNERLKKDLMTVVEERDKIWEEEAEYLKLKTVIERISAAPSAQDGLKAKVDLGCNFYAQARVEDASMIFVDVGLGFHVQLTLAEALSAIDVKTKHLHDKADKLTLQANNIKAQIRIVMEGIRELSNIDAEERTKYRDVWT